MQSVKLEDVKNVDLGEVLESAQEDWEDSYGKVMPIARGREVEAWVAAKNKKIGKDERGHVQDECWWRHRYPMRLHYS